MSDLRLTEVRFVPARADQVARGLAGYVSVVLDDTLKLDGICLRRTEAGVFTLSYPTRRDRAGRDHALVRPLSEAARVELERQVLEALNLERLVQ